jgi:DNA (cytosine-5)-methyltransferase 3A
MSCGQQALERVGIKVNNYFASEIDKYAIQVTQKNYPNTIQLGSVLDVDGYKLPKIDLLIGGSPCQSFSFAGKRKGMSTKCETEILTLEHYLQLKSEGYEFEGQSYLFWEYMRLLNEVKPKYFLLENVEMGEKWEKVLSRAIGVNGIHINSALVSAQNRKRIYWTNIGMQPMGLFGYPESIIQQPKDKGILLKDILESEVEEKYFLSEKMINAFERHKDRHNDKGTGFGYVPKNLEDKGNSLRANAALCPTDNMLIVNNTKPQLSILNKEDVDNNSIVDFKLKKSNVQIQKTIDKNTFIEGEIKALDFYNQSKHDKCPTLADPSHGHLGLIAPTKSINAVEIREVKQINPSLESGGKQPYQQDRIYDINGISPALMQGKSDLLIISGTLRTHKDGEGFREVQSGKGATIPARAREDGSGQNVVAINLRIRRLTPIECERLQTVADNYTAHVSDSQRYKMLGNGWTIDVIAHIFSYIK